MRKLLVANWKLNPESLRAAEFLARAEDKNNVIICPPSIYLPALKRVLKKAKLGAQDTFWEEKGAYTGNVSPTQLKDLGVHYVIIGHSERRSLLQESDEVINQKVEAALRAGLRVILCVGEDLEAHEKGEEHTQLFVMDQLRRGLKNIPSKDLKEVLIAYEPVWAISTSGSGLKDTPKQSEKVVSGIKDFLKGQHLVSNPRVLYGGSISPENADDYLSTEAIDGVLVGGASLDPKKFNQILLG